MPIFLRLIQVGDFFRLPYDTLTDVWFWCINMFTFYICKYICKYINLHHASLTNFEFNLIPSGSMYVVVGAGPPTRARDPNLRPYKWDKTSYSDLLIFSTTNTWWNHAVTAWCFSAFYVFTCKCIQSALHKNTFPDIYFLKQIKIYLSCLIYCSKSQTNKNNKKSKFCCH